MRPLGHSDGNVSVPKRARASAFSAVVLVVGAVAIALMLVATTADGGSPGSSPAPDSSSTAPVSGDGEETPDAAAAEPTDSSVVAVETNNSNVSVQVANSTSVDGAAGRLTDSLKTQGYITLNPTNLDGGALARTKIHHAPGFLIEARELALFLELDPEESVFPMPNDPSAGITNYNDPLVLILVGSDIAN